MIENTVLEFLTASLAWPVYMEEPEDAPEKFIIIRKTGGGRRDLISSAMFAVQSYAGTLLEAAEMNEAVKAVLDRLTELDSIAASRYNTDYIYPDTAKKRRRYQAVYEITYY